MRFEEYFRALESKSLQVLLSFVRLEFQNTSLGHGHGILRLSDSGLFSITADIQLVTIYSELPQYPIMTVIPKEDELTIFAETPDGDEIEIAPTSTTTTSNTWRSERIGLTASASIVIVRTKPLVKTHGTTVFGRIPVLEKEVYDRLSRIDDSNRFHSRSGLDTDWFEIAAAHSRAIVRGCPDKSADVRVSTPCIAGQTVENLEYWILTALGFRVGRRLTWSCFCKRTRGLDTIKLFSKENPIPKSSGMFGQLLLKPYTNVPLIADLVQFFADFPTSPLVALQYAIWDSDAQLGIVMRELAVSVSIEGLSTWIIEKYTASLQTVTSKVIQKDAAVLKVTRTKFKHRMQKQIDLVAEPYYKYLLRAVEGAKPYSAADKIRKALEVFNLDPIGYSTDIKSWQSCRNSVAHGRDPMAPLTPDRFDDFQRCVRLWNQLAQEVVLSNPKTKANVREVYRSLTEEEQKICAYYIWEKKGKRFGFESEDWAAAERELRHIILERVQEKLSTGTT